MHVDVWVFFKFLLHILIDNNTVILKELIKERKVNILWINLVTFWVIIILIYSFKDGTFNKLQNYKNNSDTSLILQYKESILDKIIILYQENLSMVFILAFNHSANQQ